MNLTRIASVVLFLVLILTTGCEKAPKCGECPVCPECPEPPLPEPLANTKWKLVGIVDAETGEVEKLEPRMAEDAYTLTFITDTKAEVRAFLMLSFPMELDLEQLGQYEFPDNHSFGTSENEVFCEALYNFNTKSYTIIHNKLMFINNAEKYYLLFEPYDKVIADEKEFQQSQILGRWKLIEIDIWYNHSKIRTIDYSENTIIYDFQENNKLVITGDIDESFVFDDFREGKHFYRYNMLFTCSICEPGENLMLANLPPPEQWQWWPANYFCRIPPDKKTMMIDKNKILFEEEIGGEAIGWRMNLIKIE